MKGTGGEIVQVQGGHILRATGRKDRHSKVYTAKGPRDRRVRLSAETAIQFYDVQDRLGYDRPSKAVDWLIKKAKNAIDKLAELPPWTIPGNTSTEPPDHHPGSSVSSAFQPQPQPGSGLTPRYVFENNPSFFPENLQNYPDHVISRETFQGEDQDQEQDHDRLGLSLHTLQETKYSGSDSTLEAFEPSDNYAKPAPVWAAGGVGDGGENRMGFISHQNPLIFCQSSQIPIREPLQSNYSHLIHAWNNPQATNHSSISSTSHFRTASDFQVPARIQGEEDDPRVFSLRPSSSSPISHY